MSPVCLSVQVPVAPAILVAYLSDPHNLPEWATEFCLAIETVDDHHRVTTPAGPVALTIVSHADSGVVDMVTRAEDAPEETLYTRVLPRPDGDSEWLVTVCPSPDAPADLLAQQQAALNREMHTVQQLFAEAQMQCCVE